MKQYHSIWQDSQVSKAIFINTLLSFCEVAGRHAPLCFMGPTGIGIFKANCVALWRLLFPFTFLIRKSKKRFIFLRISSPDGSKSGESYREPVARPGPLLWLVLCDSFPSGGTGSGAPATGHWRCRGPSVHSTEAGVRWAGPRLPLLLPVETFLLMSQRRLAVPRAVCPNQSTVALVIRFCYNLL